MTGNSSYQHLIMPSNCYGPNASRDRLVDDLSDRIRKEAFVSRFQQYAISRTIGEIGTNSGMKITSNNIIQIRIIYNKIKSIFSKFEKIKTKEESNLVLAYPATRIEVGILFTRKLS